MNYQRIYNQLITNRQNNPLPKETYTEKHHIVPKSHGGSDSLYNIIGLSAREHFVAHWLLWRIHRDSKMAHAFNNMRRSNKGVQRDNQYYNSHGFEEARKAHGRYISIVHTGNSYCLGRTLTEEHKRKTAEGNRGQKRSDESRAKMSKAQKGRIVSEEARKNMSIARTGKVLTEETKQKIAKGGTGRVQKEETKQKLRIINLDNTLYTFIHTNGDIRIDTKNNMVTDFGKHIYSVISGDRRITKGWSLVAKSH